MKQFLFGVFALILIAPIAVLHAQTPCGNILIPADFYYEGSEAESTPIENCDNPFEKTHPLTTLLLNNAPIQEGSTYPVEESGINNYGFTGENFFNTKEGADYIVTNTDFAEPTHEAIAASITEFFGGTSAREISYREAYFSGDTYSFFQSEEGDLYIDAVTGTYVYEVYEEMEDYLKTHVQSPRNPLLPGTYTVVRIDTDEGPSESFNTDNPFKQLFANLISTAHAYYNVETVTFTLAVPQEPVGASSVLFLPGIQASRLYTDGVLGTENQIWEPNINADVEKLAMTESGESVNEVYTREVIDEIALPFAGANVYKNFLSFLSDLVSSNVIASSSVFAYDWRFDVVDIAENGTKYQNEIKSLVDEVERLSATSYTNKVTIIGHSNGGLLGKSLITELEKQGKEDLIDKLVMIGTPQLGTPKAIAVMLHGYDQLAVMGKVVDDDTAREVIRNMPGAYALLPSAEYFQKTGEIVVSADSSNTTASVRVYGDIATQQSLNNFLLDVQNVRPDAAPIYEPSTLNTQLLADSLITKQKLDEWLPPSGVEVYEVVGTGNPTIKGFKYESFPCVNGLVVFCNIGTYMKATPVVTSEGDETVVALSASGQDGVKVTGVVDLILEGQQLLVSKKEHADLTESPAVQSFIDSIIKYPYLAETLIVPEFTQVSRSYKLIGFHSPVAPLVTDASGKRVGLVDGQEVEEIYGSDYFELGDSKYVVIPDDISFTAKIQGEAVGVYSLTVDAVSGSTQTRVHSYKGASTSPTMVASFEFANNTFSNVSTDQNGDGTVDLVQTLDGVVIPPPVLYSYPKLKTQIKALGLKRLAEAVLLIQVDSATYWDALLPKKPLYQKLEQGALDALKATLRLYKQKGLITQEQLLSLEVIINYLRI
jgi:pimeloyl-ACP methyl ester carboxylesterase